MKKITTFIATFILAIGAMSLTAFAADADKTVTVRIEGKSETYFYGEVKTSATNVAELMKEISDNNDSVTVYMESSDYGNYITQINDDKAGSIEPAFYDGWSDLVNGVAPSVGIDEQGINDGDVVVFYYSDEFGSHGFARPYLSEIENRIVTFVTDGYDESYNPITLPVEGATVTWDNSEYVTDDKGQIELSDKDATEGTHSVQISKYAEDGMPLVLKFASDYEFTYVSDKNIPLGDANYAVYALLMVASLAVIVVARKKVTYEK